jgi:hypothetical protein
VVVERKKIIVDELRQKLGILVEQPKPGFGSKNDGRNPEVSAEVTGLNEELIRRFSDFENNVQWVSNKYRKIRHIR